MVSNDNSNVQFGGDTEQDKGEPLRARDIIPGSAPYEKIVRQEPDSQPTEENKPSPPTVPLISPEKEHSGVNISETQMEQVKLVEDVPSAAEKTEQVRSQIPTFDLAEKIMAEQRRITAIRRKAPGQKDEADEQKQDVGAIGNTIGQPAPMLSEQEQIIADIVARDIKGLYRGGTLGVHNW